MLADRYIRTDFHSQEEFERGFTLRVPERFHFAYDVVDEYARLSPQKRAMIWCDVKGNEREFTFGDISRLSDKAANVFRAHGLKKGDPVLLMLKRRWQYWIAAVGLLKVGCVLIPATAQLQKKDIVYRVQAAGARAAICVEEPEVRERVLASARECETLKALFTLCGAEGFFNFDAEVDAAPETWEKPEDLPRNDDIMLMYFTSGTTGMPKMAVHSWTYPIAQTVTAYYWHNLGDEDIHIAVADTGWAKAGWGKLYGQWICGATLFVYDFDRFVAADMLQMISKHHVTSFCAPPTVYRFMIKEDLAQYDLSALRWANCAGEPLNPEVYDQFFRQTGVKIHEGFGQSETTPLLMTTKWMEPKAGSTGRPSPAYDVALVDENGNDVEDGVEGEIVVRLNHGRPAGLFLEYYRNREQTDAVFYDRMYHTGDMAWRDVDGYFYFIGRGDDVIKSSGYRIGPFEVESALLTHPAVLECAVTAVPHPDRGQVVKATVVLVKNRGYEPSDELKKELQTHVKRVTAPYKYPRIVEFVDELPKTVSGKIQRKLIRGRDRVGEPQTAGRQIVLEPVAEENFAAVAALRVAKGQEGFAESPLYSLSQAYALGGGRAPYAIREKDADVVGFVMFRYEADGRTEIANFMIDERKQNMGFGSAALARAIGLLEREGRSRTVHLEIGPDNEIAKALYENYGFLLKGMDDTERLRMERSL